MEAKITDLLNQYPKLSLKEVLESYNHIELTEDELAEAIISAKQKKDDQLKLEALKQKENDNRKFLTSTRFSYEQTKGLMLHRISTLFESRFKLDEKNGFYFDLLCYYFSEDEKFISLAVGAGIIEPSLSKGILLAGNFGVGKTWMMRLFCKNQRQVFHVRNAKEIANEFQASGEDNYTEKHKNPFNDAAVFYHPFSGLCIDDIGTEDIKTHFGNKKNVVGDLIETRYAKGNTGIMLHGSTNLKAEQLKEFYGGRVTSRMREIFNFIELPGNDRRK